MNYRIAFTDHEYKDSFTVYTNTITQALAQVVIKARAGYVTDIEKV